jgi:hypothetical protein
MAALLIDAGLGAARARFSDRPGRLRRRLLTGLLYLLQPLARLEGRLAHGLTPWRRRGPRTVGFPGRHSYSFWSEQWQGMQDRVRTIADALLEEGSVIRSGGDWDRWDLQVRGGLLGGARLRLAIEEHGAGRQLVRVRSWPWVPRVTLLLGALLGAVATVAVVSEADAVTVAIGAFAAAVMLRVLYECGAATATIKRALRRPLAPAAPTEANASEPPGTVGTAIG